MNELQVGGYRKLAAIDSGSYGAIYLCQKQKESRTATGEAKYYALKKFKSTIQEKNCGVHFSALSEIRLLTSMTHHNVVKCIQVVNKQLDVYMVMDFLVGVEDVRLSPAFGELQRRDLVKQLLQGISFLHNNWILHRDLKPQNIMLSREGLVKLVDFGFARRTSSPRRQLTFKVCTRQFRAPEVDFGSSFYTEKMDIWSAGCILAYLYLGRPLFDAKEGENDLDFLSDIFSLRGTPNQKVWPGCTMLPRFKQYSSCEPCKLSKVIEGLAPQAEDLLERMLELDPKRRMSSEECLQHQYFRGVSNSRLPEICQQLYKSSLDRILKRKVDE